MRTEKITGSLGLEIHDLDLSKTLSSADQAELRQLWAENGVLVIRGQQLNDDDFIRLGKIFGPLAENYFFFPNQVETKPEIAKVVKTPTEKLNTGGIWHHDQGYYPTPVKGISLYGVQIPMAGGDTLFSNLTVAYSALSPIMQDFLSNLKVVHTTRLMLAKKAQVKQSAQVAKVLEAMEEEEAIHPLVCQDPDTGKPFLYVNRTTTESIVGLSPRESATLLDFLFQHIERHEFTCRVKWKKGTLVLWNNHKCLHYAVNDYNEMRELHRIHFLPQEPVAYRGT